MAALPSTIWPSALHVPPTPVWFAISIEYPDVQVLTAYATIIYEFFYCSWKKPIEDVDRINFSILSDYMRKVFEWHDKRSRQYRYVSPAIYYRKDY